MQWALQPSQFIRVYFIVWMIVLGLVQERRVESSQNILRTNDGVMFRFLKKSWAVTDDWIHSYFIEIPVESLFQGYNKKMLENEPGTTQYANGTKLWLGHCFKYIASGQSGDHIPEAYRLMFM